MNLVPRPRTGRIARLLSWLSMVLGRAEQPTPSLVPVVCRPSPRVARVA
jgi:hypothetical protein